MTYPTITIRDIAAVERGRLDPVAYLIETSSCDTDWCSGQVGPSFATSGPGAGWAKQFDATDYAQRALEEGACAYVDSYDGRAATLDEEGDVVWTDGSVITFELPSAEEALEHPVAFATLCEAVDHYTPDDPRDDIRPELWDMVRRIDDLHDALPSRIQRVAAQAAA